MDKKIKIFVSWSKGKSKKLAEATKDFLNRTMGQSIDFFFSPEMYKGSCADAIIHQNLIKSDICIVCITYENFKNPWLMYESGVVCGANYRKRKEIVIPILFEHIPDWSSWVDKPLNRYTPIQLKNYNNEYSDGKREFKTFLKKLSNETKIGIKNFESNWKLFEHNIENILSQDELVPFECKFIVNTLLENSNAFTISSPDISKGKIVFHKGFTTHVLTRILTNSVVMENSNTLWIYGRRNRKILSREYDDFFKYLANEGILNGKDFRCLFPMPNTEAVIKACSKYRKNTFDSDLKETLNRAMQLKNKFGLPVEKLFRLYRNKMTESIIIIDSAILHRYVVKDSEGYPLPFTNSEFEIDAKSSKKGIDLIRKFESVWNEASPLTDELLNELYPSNE